MSYFVQDLVPGGIILVRGRGIFADAIRWSTGSPYTHAVYVLDRETLIEGLATVVESPADKYKNVGDFFTLADMAFVDTAAVSVWMRKHLGRRYGVKEILLDALRFDLHFVPRPRPLRHYTCSGLICAGFGSAGVILTRAPWPAPSDLAYSPLLLDSRVE